MLNPEITEKMKVLAGLVTETVLTEEQLDEMLVRTQDLLEANGVTIDAEDLESFVAGLEDALENCELSEEARAELQEFLPVLAGIARGVGSALATGARAVGGALSSGAKAVGSTVAKGASALGKSALKGAKSAVVNTAKGAAVNAISKLKKPEPATAEGVQSEEAPLTEEMVSEAISSIDAILEANGIVVEAEELESFIAGVEEALETCELSESDRTKLQECLTTMAQGVAPLTEELMFEAVARVDAILETNGMVVEAEDLEAFIAGVQEAMDSYELSEADREELQELLGALGRGISKIAGGVGKVVGTYRRAKTAVRSGIDKIKGTVAGAKDAYHAGVAAAQHPAPKVPKVPAPKPPPSAAYQAARAATGPAGHAAVHGTPPPAAPAAKPAAPPPAAAAPHVPTGKLVSKPGSPGHAAAMAAVKKPAESPKPQSGMKPDMAMGKTKVTHGAAALVQPERKRQKPSRVARSERRAQAKLQAKQPPSQPTA